MLRRYFNIPFIIWDYDWMPRDTFDGSEFRDSLTSWGNGSLSTITTCVLYIRKVVGNGNSEASTGGMIIILPEWFFHQDSHHHHAVEGFEGVAKRVDTPLDVENCRRRRSQEAVNYQDIGNNQAMLNAICITMIWMELSFNLIISWLWVDDFEQPPWHGWFLKKQKQS